MRLDEIRVFRGRGGEDGPIEFVYHAGNLWLIKNDIQYLQARDKIRKSLRVRSVPEDLTDLRIFASESRPDVIFGAWYPKTKKLAVDLAPASYSARYVGALDIKKIAKTLGAKTIVADEGTESPDTFKAEEILSQPDLPTTLYHGTCSSRLRSILSIGLRKDSEHINWPAKENQHTWHRGDLKFNLVFLTTSISEAAFHAVRTADNQDSAPVILKVIVPDKNLLFPDYDVAVQRLPVSKLPDVYRPKITKKSPRDPRLISKLSDMNMNRPKKILSAGSVAYNGNIPPAFIVSVYGNVGDIVRCERWGDTASGEWEDGEISYFKQIPVQTIKNALDDSKCPQCLENTLEENEDGDLVCPNCDE